MFWHCCIVNSEYQCETKKISQLVLRFKTYFKIYNTKWGYLFFCRRLKTDTKWGNLVDSFCQRLKTDGLSYCFRKLWMSDLVCLYQDNFLVATFYGTPGRGLEALSPQTRLYQSIMQNHVANSPKNTILRRYVERSVSYLAIALHKSYAASIKVINYILLKLCHHACILDSLNTQMFAGEHATTWQVERNVL